MRYGLLSRTPSPEPEEIRKPRGRFSFGLSLYDTSDEEEAPNSPESSSSSTSDESDSEGPNQAIRHNNVPKLSDERQREIKEIVSSFRLAGEYEDPFKKWVMETRTAAFRAANNRYESNPASIAATRRRQIELRDQRLKATYDRECDEVARELEALSVRQKLQQQKLLYDYQDRERLLWQRIDGTIKAEEEKERNRRETEERARKEEAERLQREEIERLRKEEERRIAEEERKKEEEKERVLQAELEQKRKERQEREDAEARERAEALAKIAAENAELAAVRKHARYRTAKEDWDEARAILQDVKRTQLPATKANDSLRPIHSKGRRTFVSKIGQLTNSAKEIERITSTILNVVHSNPPHPQSLYLSLTSSLAKAILMQAETEVSARAVTAIPLAQVTVHLLTHIPDFSEVLYARMIQRTGGWAVPITVPKPNDLSELEYKKLRGYRTEREPQKDFESRVAAIMTLYFTILTTEVTSPMPVQWSFPRFWTYLARLISSPILMRNDLAASILAAALQVGGTRVKRAYGVQFVKMLALLYGAVKETESSASQPIARQVGAEGVEGKPGRVRLLLEIEELMAQQA